MLSNQRLAASLLAGAIALSGCAQSANPTASTPLTSSEQFPATTWNFDHDTPGSIPTGAGIFSGQWTVRAEPGALSAPNALCQTASTEFPALQLTAEGHRDMRVTAQVKPISGREDQAAGVLLRVQDAKNYYIVRANALEGSVVIFKYVNGSRSELKSGSAAVTAGAWQELRGEVSGTTIRGFVGARLVVEATDATFKQGGAGLWTKADSVTCFDDVTLAALGGQ
ncbi:MAG: hypothetical protein M3T56_01620 [Chloroflexota bacterium]|nr:hypothetical protein [Chloroflexota bacterium]